jgi:hypothetical protein
MGESVSCAGFSFVGRRYPFTSACTESNDTRGRKGMYLKEGRRYAEEVRTSDRVGIEEGREELVIETLWNG